MTFALNALWQIAAVTLALALCDLLLRRAAHRARTAFWTAGLLVAAALPWIPAPTTTTFAAAAPIIINTASSAGSSERSVLAWPAILIVALAALRLARLAWGLSRLRKIRAESESAPGGILISRSVAAPLTFGMFRPVIVVPEDFWTSAPDAVRLSVIEHERAHVARHDYGWNLAVEIATIAVWWHPAVAWMKHRLAALREFACDEMAAARTPGYAAAIVEAARIIAERRSPQYALGFFDSSNLEERVMKLIHRTPRSTPAFARLSLAGAFLTLMICATAIVMRPVVLAQDNGPVYKIGDNVTPPSLIEKQEPKYSESAREAKVEGTVTLKVVIGANGSVESAEVFKGLEQSLDINAIEAVTLWKFKPATKDGKPVRVAATIEVNYRLI